MERDNGVERIMDQEKNNCRICPIEDYAKSLGTIRKSSIALSFFFFQKMLGWISALWDDLQRNPTLALK